MSALLVGGEDGESVNLSFRSLAIIPEQIWDSHQLKKLVLAGNPISTISPRISRLTNLQYLNCGSSELTFFPAEAVPHLQSLTYLNLSGNRIVELPDNIGLMSNLTEMLLGTNNLSRVPSSLGDLESLTILKLGKCKLTELPIAVARLKNLKELQVSENAISGAIPAFVYRLPHLESLDLSYNKFDSILDNSLISCSDAELDAFFTTMGSLRVLTLNDNLFDIIPPHTLSNFTSLSVLQLSFNRLTSLPSDLCKAQSIVMIDIASNKVTKLHPEWGQLINMSSFDVAYNDLTEIPSTYTNMEALRVFTLVGNNFLELPEVCQKLVDRGVRMRFNDASSLPNHILPGLYLGGVSAARDKYTLKRLGVNHVLTVAEIDPLYADDFVYKVVRVDDHADQDLGAFFEECRQFIYDGIQAGGVLVHCAAGVSRSATIVIMYVMTVERLSYEAAFQFVREKRPIICPNNGFRDQLHLYEHEVFKKDQTKCIVA